MGKVIGFETFAQRRGLDVTQGQNASPETNIPASAIEGEEVLHDDGDEALSAERLMQVVKAAKARNVPRVELSLRLRLMFAGEHVRDLDVDHYFNMKAYIQSLHLNPVLARKARATYDQDGALSKTELSYLIEIINGSTQAGWSQKPAYYAYILTLVESKLLDLQPETEVIKRLLDSDW